MTMRLPAERIRRLLLSFFDTSRRDLPWRGTDDPYGVWVSEVMLQQTRVEAVVPYYERWMARFPDVAALATAPLDDVLTHWEGLGYYSRARNLHSAARLVRERHAGAVPSSYKALRELPGVGDYTAGAVASIAYGAREPAVDGNVRRVLARLLDEPRPSPRELRAEAAALVDPARPGDFNQALMELGATVCTPRTPRCNRCPLSDVCAAYAAGTQLDRPQAKRRAAIPTYDVATLVLRRADGRMLVTRRPDTGLLARMWTFPGREVNGVPAEEAAVRFAGELTRADVALEPLATIEHTFSHRRERYVCFIANVSDAASDADHAWIDEWREGIALPRAQQKIHAAALDRG